MALAKPPRSRLRKMSPKTLISNQIQMKNMKNQSIDQNTWPVPKSASINRTSFLVVGAPTGCRFELLGHVTSVRRGRPTTSCTSAATVHHTDGRAVAAGERPGACDESRILNAPGSERNTS